MCDVAIDSTHGHLRAIRLADGHVVMYVDPLRPGGGSWVHACPKELLCGQYASIEQARVAINMQALRQLPTRKKF